MEQIPTTDPPNKIVNGDNTNLCKLYICEIRNIKLLSDEMINNIRHMSHEDKMNIIIAFNDILENLQLLLE